MRKAWKKLNRFSWLLRASTAELVKKKKRDTLKVLIMNNYMPLVLF